MSTYTYYIKMSKFFFLQVGGGGGIIVSLSRPVLPFCILWIFLAFFKCLLIFSKLTFSKILSGIPF